MPKEKQRINEIKKANANKRITEKRKEKIPEPIIELSKTKKPITSEQQKKLDQKLLYAVKEGDTKTVEELLRLGADKNYKIEYGTLERIYIGPERCLSGTSLLSIASGLGYYDICKLLIELGVDVNMRETDFGYTPLRWATYNRSIYTCKLLIENGAEVNIRDENGRTALFWAAWTGYIDATRYLLSVGANPLITDNDRRTVCDAAGISWSTKEILDKWIRIWKNIGEKRATNILHAVKDCSPEKMTEIVKML